MKRRLRPTVITALFLLAGFFGAGCNNTDPPEGCRGHGGVAEFGRDATNGHVPFACKDGTVGRVDM